MYTCRNLDTPYTTILIYAIGGLELDMMSNVFRFCIFKIRFDYSGSSSLLKISFYFLTL